MDPTRRKAREPRARRSSSSPNRHRQYTEPFERDKQNSDRFPLAGNSFDERTLIIQNESGRRSGGRLCWRATRQGITGWRLIGTMSAAAAAERRRCRFPFHIGSINLPMPQKLAYRSLLHLTRLARRATAQALPESDSPGSSGAVSRCSGRQFLPHRYRCAHGKPMDREESRHSPKQVCWRSTPGSLAE